MKTGKTLQELAIELERQRDSKKDFLATTPALTLKSNGTSYLKLGDENFEVADTAHEQLAARLEIPKKYYDRLKSDAPELLDTNVNHWFNKNPEKRLVRTLDNKVRAFLSDRYRPLDNYDLAENALPVLLKSGCVVQSCEVTDRRLYLKVVSPKMTYQVKVGDTVQAGIVISNSEIGNGSLSIEPMLYRLICLNGAVMNDSRMKKNHVGRGNEFLDGVQEFYTNATRAQDDKAFWMKVRDTIEHAFSEIGFDKHIASFTASIEDRIEKEPEKTIELVQKNYSLSDGESKGVLYELIKSGDMSRFGLINAVTSFAQTVDSYDRSTELERIGGSIIELPRSDWARMAA
jgi:hypothetical protein